MPGPRPLIAFKHAALAFALTAASAATGQGAADSSADRFRYYGLDIDGVEQRFGTFESSGFELAMHIFRPRDPHATVILLHGYLDHAGTLAHAVHALLEHGYRVALYDQPGHGLSSGERAAIDDFARYVTSLGAFRAEIAERPAGPVHLVAFSMGGAVAVDYLLTREPDIERVVLVAPLVRSRHWRLSRLFYGIVGLFTDSVRRAFRKTSSDRGFLERLERDPLQPRTVPLQWFGALVAWNEHIEDAPPSPRTVKIIQGTADSVVAWRFNLAFLQRKLPRAKVALIADGRHHLFNETPRLRGDVLKHMIEHLSTDSTEGAVRQALRH